MVSRKLFPLLLLLAIQFIAKAQTSIGIEAGISSSYLNTNISNRASTAINYNIGYTFGIPFQYRINKWLYLETDLGITQKNYFVDRTDSLAGIYEKYRNNYLQVPLLLKFVYGKRLKIFADAGVYGAYWLSSYVLGRIPNIFGVDSSFQLQNVSYSQKYQFNTQTDNRVEMGWVVGLGAQYHLTAKYILTFSCKDYQSLTDQQKGYMINQVPKYNQTFAFSFGGMVTFK